MKTCPFCGDDSPTEQPVSDPNNREITIGVTVYCHHCGARGPVVDIIPGSDYSFDCVSTVAAAYWNKRYCIRCEEREIEEDRLRDD